MPQGEGVVGSVGDASGIGVHARNDFGGIALAVNSKARFKVCGKAAIQQGASSTIVSAPVSPATSLVFLTPLGDPGQATLWVEVGTGSFTVHLGGGGGGGGAHTTIPFAWFAIEQAA